MIILRSDTLTTVGTIQELWQIIDYSVDSLAVLYKSDYRLKYIEVDRPLQFNDMVVTSVKSNNVLPDKYFLNQNYPNPFNPTTTISFNLPKQETVSLKIYDLSGREIRTLINRQGKTAGKHKVAWNGKNNAEQEVSSGLYIYVLKTKQQTMSKKLLLLK